MCPRASRSSLRDCSFPYRNQRILIENEIEIYPFKVKRIEKLSLL